MPDHVLHTDNPDRDGNLTADEYASRARKRAEDGGPCHPPLPPEAYELDD